MRIATFNANSIRSRLDIVLGWLQESGTDLLCVQETKAQDIDFPQDAFLDAGYHLAFRGQKAYNGVALVSRQKPVAVRYGLDDGLDPDETRLIAARIGSVSVVNTYVPQGRAIDHEMFRYKLDWFRRLRWYFERHFSPRSRLVWVGDMNVAPEPKDVHDPAAYKDDVCFHAAARKAFAETVSWGFLDVFRQHHPEEGHFSFFDYRMRGSVKRGHGWRIDHILATRSLARRCVDSFIDMKPRTAEKPSDHTFVLADFDL